jgi:hypothetical protein
MICLSINLLDVISESERARSVSIVKSINLLGVINKRERAYWARILAGQLDPFFSLSIVVNGVFFQDFIARVFFQGQGKLQTFATYLNFTFQIVSSSHPPQKYTGSSGSALAPERSALAFHLPFTGLCSSEGASDSSNSFSSTSVFFYSCRSGAIHRPCPSSLRLQRVGTDARGPLVPGWGRPSHRYRRTWQQHAGELDTSAIGFLLWGRLLLASSTAQSVFHSPEQPVNRCQPRRCRCVVNPGMCAWCPCFHLLLHHD